MYEYIDEFEKEIERYEIYFSTMEYHDGKFTPLPPLPPLRPPCRTVTNRGILSEQYKSYHEKYIDLENRRKIINDKLMSHIINGQ